MNLEKKKATQCAIALSISTNIVMPLFPDPAKKLCAVSRWSPEAPGGTAL
jgi:hypothetical protein